MGYSFLKEKLSKNWIRAMILMDNSQIEYATCTIEKDDTIKFKGKRYNIDTELLHYDKHIPYQFYIEKNPNPVRFSKISNYIEGKPVNSKTFNDIIETKVIQDMVNAGRNENIVFFILGVIIVLLIVNLMISSGVIDISSQTAINATVNATKTVVANASVR